MTLESYKTDFWLSLLPSSVHKFNSTTLPSNSAISVWIQANLFGTLERRIYSLVPHRFFKQLQIKYLLFFETGVFKKIFKIHRKTPLVDSLSDQPATCYDFKEGLPHRCFLWGLQTFKLACVFNIKLFFYGLILLIKSCKTS